MVYLGGRQIILKTSSAGTLARQIDWFEEMINETSNRGLRENLSAGIRKCGTMGILNIAAQKGDRVCIAHDPQNDSLYYPRVCPNRAVHSVVFAVFLPAPR